MLDQNKKSSFILFKKINFIHTWFSEGSYVNNEKAEKIEDGKDSDLDRDVDNYRLRIFIYNCKISSCIIILTNNKYTTVLCLRVFLLPRDF